MGDLIMRFRLCFGLQFDKRSLLWKLPKIHTKDTSISWLLEQMNPGNYHLITFAAVIVQTGGHFLESPSIYSRCGVFMCIKVFNVLHMWDHLDLITKSALAVKKSTLFGYQEHYRLTKKVCSCHQENKI